MSLEPNITSLVHSQAELYQAPCADLVVYAQFPMKEESSGTENALPPKKISTIAEFTFSHPRGDDKLLKKN